MSRNFVVRPLALLACLSLVIPSAAAEDGSAVTPASHCCDAAGCGDTCCDDGCCDDGCCGDGCCYGCVSSVEKVKVEKHCWNVECKQVCVPKVVCPWDEGGSGLTLFSWMKKKGGSAGCGDACCGDVCGSSCCGSGCCDDPCGCCMKPRCGEVKCVRDIKKEKYECEECVCKWEIRRLPVCCNDGCCGSNGCCGNGGCGDACCDPGCGCPMDCGAQAAPAAKSTELKQPEVQLTSATVETTPEVAQAETEKSETTPWYRRVFSR